MSYSMESKKENERLRKQNATESYSVSKELQMFSFSKQSRILDAGCGAGDVHRQLLKQYGKMNIDAFDLSQERLVETQKENENEGYLGVNFFQSDIYQINKEDNIYDTAICRYVTQHLENPQAAINELKRVLKPGGHLILIDIDGILFNIVTENKFINESLKIINENINFDLRIARKLPLLLQQADLKNIEYTITPMKFEGEEREREIENYATRFSITRPLFSHLFGSEVACQKFINSYLAELEKGAVLFYNKFIVSGYK